MSLLRYGICVGLLVSFGGNAFANALQPSRVEFRQFFPLGQNGRVSIENRYGDVSIVAWDRDEVLVEAVKRGATARVRDEAQIVVEPSPGSLSIHTQYAGEASRRPAKVEYRISVPRSTTLAEVKLANGGLFISGVSGPVKASSINGGIEAQRLEGRAELSTVNGSLEADFERVNPSSPITLRSVNGPITLGVPGGVRPNLSAHNVSGGIDSEFGHAARVNGAQQLELRGSGAKIRLDNVNGGITIHSTAPKHAGPHTDL